MEFEESVKSFRDLIVWNRAIELCIAVYKFTSLFPKDELFGLRSQLRRAAVSVPSNIAEGSAKKTRGEFQQFLGIARGSTAEVQTQLLIAKKLGFSTVVLHAHCDQLATEVSRMLPALSQSLNKTDH